MKLLNRSLVVSALGFAVLGCWGSDYKIGDVLSTEEPPPVDSFPSLAADSLGLTPCGASSEIQVYASLDGTLNCAGTTCTLESQPGILATWAGSSPVGVTYDGSNVVLLAGVLDAGGERATLYSATVGPGRVDTLRVFDGTPGAGFAAAGNMVVVGAPSGELHDPRSATSSRVYRFEPDGPKLIATVPGAARNIAATADGFALEGSEEVFDGSSWRHVEWLSRHDAAGVTLWSQELAESSPNRAIALGGQGTLFEYRSHIEEPSSLARYDLEGQGRVFASLPSSHRQGIAAGANDAVVIASSLGGAIATDFGVRGYDPEGNEIWTFNGLVPASREPVRAIIAENGDAYVAGTFRSSARSKVVLGVLRFSPGGEVCLAGSWSSEQSIGFVGIVETADGVVVATPRAIGIVPKR